MYLSLELTNQLEVASKLYLRICVFAFVYLALELTNQLEVASSRIEVPFFDKVLYFSVIWVVNNNNNEENLVGQLTSDRANFC